MAEAIASFLAEQLATRIIESFEQHVKLAVDAKEEVKRLGRTFRTISLVLDDAEMKQFNDEGVKNWLKQFKDVANDMDDILDEWQTEVLRSKIEGTPPHKNDPRYIKIKEKVPSSYFCLSPFSKCFKKGVLYYNLGSRIKGARETLDSICEEQNKFEFAKSDHKTITSKNNDGIPKDRETSSVLVDASNIISRDKDKEFIVKKLLGQSETTGSSTSSSQPENEAYDHRIISIIGLGGLGKTTLAQLIIEDDQVKNHFGKKNIFWVCVSEPFDRTRIAKAIIYEATKKSTNTSDWNPLHNELIDAVKAKQFLLVLDDLWTEDEVHLNPFKDLLQLGTQGSRIMITTRQQGVAKTMNSVQCHLGLLTDAECWSLLRRKAFIGRDIIDNEAFHKIGFKIAERCGGLPLAASILGGLLKNKKTEMDWQRVLDSELWNLKPIDKKLFKPLLLSYEHLPSALRRCFSYCAVFPKDHIIEKHILIKMWMAQGFLNSSTTGEKLDPESIGEQYFNYLAEGSFLQEITKEAFNYENIVVECKMHDLVHDFAQSLWKNIDEHGMGSSSFPNTVKFEVKSLRTLLVSPNSEHYSVINDWLCRPADLFPHLRCLRVLKLENMNIEKLPGQIKELIHLRYLDLSYNESLTELPNSVCSLYNLQTLSLYYCRSFDKLPQGMEKMMNLKHLYLDYTAPNLTLPEEIGKLTSLQTLDKVINITAGASGVSELRVLKDLNLLQGKLEIKGLGNLETANEASQAELNKKKGLEVLKLDFNKWDKDAPEAESMESVFGALQPHPKLKKLRIRNFGGRAFPVGWLKRLTSLCKLSLDKCFNLTELPALGLLQSLTTLKLSHLNNIKCIGLEFSRYPNLKNLTLLEMKGLEELDLGVVEERSAAVQKSIQGGGGGGEIIIMPSLITFVINGCRKLKTVGGLQSLEALQCLHITKCPNLKSSLLQQLHFPNLEDLTITGYGGQIFPVSWFERFTSLCTLRLNGCFNCSELPALGSLPSLEYLSLKSLENIKCIRLEISRFPNLEYLSLNKMKELEELDFGVVEQGSTTAVASGGGEIIVTPRLTYFDIWGCPKLKTLRGLQSLQLLQTLIISECPNLNSSLLQQLHLPDLNYLSMLNCASLSDKLPTSSPNLASLVIDGASHSLPPQGLGELKKLQYLEFVDCSFMTSIPEDVRHLAALQTLLIADCEWPPQKIHPDCRIDQEYDEEAWSIMSHIPNIKIGRKQDGYFLISTRTPTGTRQQFYKRCSYNDGSDGEEDMVDSVEGEE